jgi:crotonobetainyl-CoA:carnitine CoA-transferase CaiB-like acyl-CoA transferase
MDGVDKPRDNFSHDKRPKSKMSNKMENQGNWAATGRSTTAFSEEKIKKLKNRLEEARARSHTRSHWEGMLEDCEIILNHLETGKQKAKAEIGARATIT